MTARVVVLRDTWTVMHCLIVQFEEVDREWCAAIGVMPGFKVVVRIERGGSASCFSGGELRDQFGATIEALSQPMRSDGTISTFKELLHFVDDIRTLPAELDVEDLRDKRNWLRSDLLGDALREAVAEHAAESLRKVLFEAHGWTHIALVDVASSEKVFDQGSTGQSGRMVAAFLWLPVPEASAEELQSIELSPFAVRVL